MLTVYLYSERFAGTGISTFSKYIYWTRTHRDTNFPETYPAKLRFQRGLDIKLVKTEDPPVNT